MSTLKKPLALICLLCTMLGSLHAAELKLATLNMQKIFDEFHRTLKFELELRNSADMDYLRKLEGEADGLRRQAQDLESRMRSLTLSEEAKKDLFERYRQLVPRMEAKREDLRGMQQKIDRSKMAERKSITDELEERIGDYSKEQGYDLVLDLSGATTNGIPPVIYSNAAFSITDAIIARINQGQEEQITKLKADIEAADVRIRAEIDARRSSATDGN